MGIIVGLKTWRREVLSLSDMAGVVDRSEMTAFFLRMMVILVLFLVGIALDEGWVGA